MNCLETWNIRRINRIADREKAVNVFRKGEYEMLAFTDTRFE